MLDSLVGTILTDARTVLDDLDPFLLELEVSAERADTALLSTIYNTTPLLSNCFNLLGLTDAVALVDLLQLVTGAFRKQIVSLSYVNIREVIRGFSALLAFLDSADAERISIAVTALKELVENTWASEATSLLATHTLRDPMGQVAFSVAGHVLQDDFMQESTCFVLELDGSGQLAGAQFTPFSLLQFLFKSGQVLGVQFAPPKSGAYLYVLFATVLNAEQLQMVLDIPEQALHVVSMSAFDSENAAWQHAEATQDVATKELEQASFVQDAYLQNGYTQAAEVSGSAEISNSVSASPDKFAMLEAELEGELFEEALSAGISARSFDKAQQELPEKVEEPKSSQNAPLETSEASSEVAREGISDGTSERRSSGLASERATAFVAEPSVESSLESSIKPTVEIKELHGFSFERDGSSVLLYVSSIENAVEAEQLRAALLELLSSHANLELVLRAPIRGNLELLQLLLSAAMTAGLRRQQFRVTGKGKESVATLLSGCGITLDVLKAQGIADFLG